MRSYRLVCCACGATYADDGVRLDCDITHGPALLRTQYATDQFDPGDDTSMLRYRAWLPLAREVASRARTAVYRSAALGAYLGLEQLWIAFSGWWPERGATLETGSFKDLEALAVLGRFEPSERRTLVIASAGNTAAAFARICSDNDMPALIVIPLRAWQHLASAGHLGPCVRVVGIADGEYEQAIAFARELASTGDFLFEGGVRNVGRRDGMGTVMLAAAETLGALPAAYFQAIGSGAGALAAHEAALRLVASGGFGTRLPRLMLSQNSPFTPVHDAWQARSPELLVRDPARVPGDLAAQGATVLSNQAPPYGIAGGLREALVASGGNTYAIENAQMANAMSLFAELEGIDIEPAAGVMVASLINAVRAGEIGRNDVVLAHVTGGGRRGRRAVTTATAPALIVDHRGLDRHARESARALFR